MWHYQIIKQHGVYQVHEVINDEEIGWTTDEVSPYGETRDELRQSFTAFINDILHYPVLVVEDDVVVGEEEPISELLTLEFIREVNNK